MHHLCDQVLHSEPDPTELHHVTLLHLDIVWLLLLLDGPVLDLFRPVQFPCPLVHQSDDEPGLLEMIVLVVYLSVGLVQRPSMVDPVRTMLIHEGKEQLVILRHAQLRHHTLEGVVVPREL